MSASWNKTVDILKTKRLHVALAAWRREKHSNSWLTFLSFFCLFNKEKARKGLQGGHFTFLNFLSNISKGSGDTSHNQNVTFMQLLSEMWETLCRLHDWNKGQRMSPCSPLRLLCVALHPRSWDKSFFYQVRFIYVPQCNKVAKERAEHRGGCCCVYQAAGRLPLKQDVIQYSHLFDGDAALNSTNKDT